MPHPPAAPPNPGHLPVLDAPGPWALQLIAATDNRARNALFRSCRQLREMVLAASTSVRLHLDPHQDLTGAATVKSCQHLTSCKSGVEVRLEINAWPKGEELADDSPQAVQHTTSWIANICDRMNTSPSLPLHHVTCITLEGVITRELVPAPLAAACPNLNYIRHYNYRPWLAVAGQAPQAIHCPQIRHLLLESEGWAFPPEGSEAAWRDVFKKQLQALPNLHKLSLWAPTSIGYKPQSYWAYGVSAVRHQITSFELVSENRHMFIYGTLWPQLQHLYMGSWSPSFDQLEAMFPSMPQLPTLALSTLYPYRSKKPNVALTLALSHLSHVVVNTIYISTLAWAAFARLQSFHFSILEVHARDLSFVHDAIVNIGRCPNVGAVQNKVIVNHQSFYDDEPGIKILAALVPLLRAISFQALQLPSRLFDEEGSATVLSKLPQLRLLHLHSFAIDNLEVSLTKLKALCAQARWPITLWMEEYSAREYKQELSLAMEEAGHQHVVIEEEDQYFFKNFPCM